MKLFEFGGFPAVTGPYEPDVEAGASEWGEVLDPNVVLLRKRNGSHPHNRPPWHSARLAEGLFGDVVHETCDCADTVVPRIELTNALWGIQAMGKAFTAICLECGEGFEVQFPDSPGIPNLSDLGYPW